jgi:hypothetical protein
VAEAASWRLMSNSSVQYTSKRLKFQKYHICIGRSRYTRIECGAINYKEAIKIKGSANDEFRKGNYAKASELYKQVRKRSVSLFLITETGSGQM